MVYDVSDPSWGDKHPELNVEYVLYLTPEGYVLGFEPAEESIDQYLYVDDSDEELKDWVAARVPARRHHRQGGREEQGPRPA